MDDRVRARAAARRQSVLDAFRREEELPRVFAEESTDENAYPYSYTITTSVEGVTVDALKYCTKTGGNLVNAWAALSEYFKKHGSQLKHLGRKVYCVPRYEMRETYSFYLVISKVKVGVNQAHVVSADHDFMGMLPMRNMQGKLVVPGTTGQ